MIHHDQGLLSFENQGTSGQYQFAIKDHLGNTRVLFADINNNGSINYTTEILNQSEYYPFGMEKTGSWQKPSTYDYRYNGKELEEAFELNWYNYGARFYDPSIGRWTTTDPMADLYSPYSPYSYVLNRPLNAIDPDGQLVIFINGLGGGGADYWKGTKRFFVPPLNIIKYNYDFADRVKTQLNDSNAMFYDGSPGGIGENTSAAMRYSSGRATGKKDAEAIIAKLARDSDGNITESIKVITHSMGALFGKGFLAALYKYIKDSDDPKIRKIQISLIADFDGYQNGTKYGTNYLGIRNQQFIHSGWGSLLGWLANDQSKNTEDATVSTGSSAHALSSFLLDISNLEEGEYKWDDKSQSWKCTNCKN